MNCVRCGAAMPQPAGRFCPNCGAAITENPVTAAGSAPVVQWEVICDLGADETYLYFPALEKRLRKFLKRTLFDNIDLWRNHTEMPENPAEVQRLAAVWVEFLKALGIRDHGFSNLEQVLEAAGIRSPAGEPVRFCPECRGSAVEQLVGHDQETILRWATQMPEPVPDENGNFIVPNNLFQCVNCKWVFE